jgi:HEAT repeat protein
VRALAARVQGELAQRGDAQAARELAGLVEEQEDLELKLMALQAMVAMNPERARPILVELMRRREPAMTELRRQAIFLLIQGEVEGVEDLIVEVVREDPDPEVRKQAVFWLAQVGSARAVDVLVDLIMHGDDPEVQGEAIFALSQVDDARVGDLLQRIAADPEQPTENREAAIFWLGQHDDSRYLEFLRDLYGRLEDPALKERVLFGVAQADAEDAEAWLLEIALDSQETMDARKMALFWAAKEKRVPVAKLVEIYGDVDDRALREQILYALAETGTEDALRALMTLAKSETDLELRKAAVFWIGHTGGDQAEDFLIDIIEQ